MPELMSDKNIKKVYNMLMTQTFADWHDGEFMDHVEGEENCKNKKEICEELKLMLL